MKLIADYRSEEFTRAVVPYVTLKEVAHGMVCLSESHWGLNFWGLRYYYRLSSEFLFVL